MNAVGKDASWPHQTKVVVYVQIALAPGEELANPGAFMLILRKVGLQVDAGMSSMNKLIAVPPFIAKCGVSKIAGALSSNNRTTSM